MNARTMRRIRQLHLYLGLLFAPMLLLFAVSGGLQTFRLNEPKGYGGTPPAWMVWFAAIHKDQSPPREKSERPQQTSPGGRDARPDNKAEVSRAQPARTAGLKKAVTLPLKIFTVMLAIALAASTLLGITIALNSKATRATGLIMLAIGTLLPIILLKIKG